MLFIGDVCLSVGVGFFVLFVGVFLMILGLFTRSAYYEIFVDIEND